MKQYLVGRTGTTEAKEYIEEVMRKYERTYAESNEDRLRAELEKVQKQLELYERYAWMCKIYHMLIISHC